MEIRTAPIDGNMREIAFSQPDFERIAQIVLETSGICIPKGKDSLVYSRLVPRVQRLGFASFRQYLSYLMTPEAVDENQGLINALTTNTTNFFREEHHFEALKTQVLPELVSHARRGGRVRLWSAGCSSGEEACTIAFCLLDQCPEASSLDIRILATDIDGDVLKRARSGHYPARSIAKLPEGLAERHFEPSHTFADEKTVNVRLRSLVTYRQLNLVKPWPFRRPFDVVFCRNVAIYFNADTQDQLWNRFKDVLQPGGYLFMGHSERLSNSVKQSFEPVAITTYRLKSKAAPASPLERGVSWL
tara:strand:- start:446 stop:1354 length:909 start_codon:yes stop_codon:yes gene_type:complete